MRYMDDGPGSSARNLIGALLLLCTLAPRSQLGLQFVRRPIVGHDVGYVAFTA